ncbi:hypothetical protein [Haloarcula laminariae]|uniref:hypothetical protein n=1 Tax=Haloarcula laminariae TaxID=2961577 RepID=UPI002404DC34|nr:hypothetical protein [Halomicroarcula sp. FL173]
MGLSFDLVPFTKREIPPDARVYSHLPESFRERFIRICQPYITDRNVQNIYEEFFTEFDHDIEHFEVFKDGSIKSAVNSHREFIREGEDERVIDYIEYVLNYLAENVLKDETLTFDSRIRRAFREERVLFRLRPERRIIESQTSNRHGYSVANAPYHLEYLGNEPMVQADNDAQVLSGSSRWRDAINHYNQAWDYYQDGQFNSNIPEELAKSVESVAYTICKDEQEWVDDGAGLGRCLDEMKNQGLFEPNNELYPEAEKIFIGLKLSAQKAGGDKHRHEDVNQHYTLLLLHQTAAFISYVMNRYDEQYT